MPGDGPASLLRRFAGEARLAEAYEAKGGRTRSTDTLIDECRTRWTGLYVILHTGDESTHLGIFGYSGD